MRAVLMILLCFRGWTFAAQTDFDVAVVGTSPVSLLEAIYHGVQNKRVLILEKDPSCGGAWKSLDVCGVLNADLGCHLLGSNAKIKNFFESYFGCYFVCLEHPDHAANSSHQHCKNGFYFSQGCHEFISRLLGKLATCPNAQLLNKRLESIFIDQTRGWIELNLGDRRYTTAKLIITPYSHFGVENILTTNFSVTKRHTGHLYLLIEDQVPPQFTYLNNITPGVSRAMNLTPFLQMPEQDRQLIVIQTRENPNLDDAQKFLDAFKRASLLSAEAKIVQVESYLYHQTLMNVASLKKLGGSLIEILDTSGFSGMIKYLERWKGVLIPIPIGIGMSQVQGSGLGNEDLQ